MVAAIVMSYNVKLTKTGAANWYYVYIGFTTVFLDENQSEFGFNMEKTKLLLIFFKKSYFCFTEVNSGKNWG